MSELPVFIRVRSEYFESDTSKYRLAVTAQTLAESLRHQTNQGFSIVLNQSPLDPFFTKRSSLFRMALYHSRVHTEGLKSDSSHDIDSPEILSGKLILEHDFIDSPLDRIQRIEIEVGDDDFLRPQFIENIMKVPLQTRNTSIMCPNGYVFFEGILRPWRSREELIQTTMIVEQGKSGRHEIRETVLCTNEASWIYVRHQMNSVQIPSEMIDGSAVKGLKWDGWNQNLVALYSKTTVKTATANGCTLEPMKSKSVRIASTSSRQRRFKK